MTAGSAIMSGLSFGLTLGLMPGPTSTLVINQTLQYGFREGGKVAISPIVADIPIIIIVAFFFPSLAKVSWFLGVLSLAGGGFLAFLAYESFKIPAMQRKKETGTARSLQKGMLTNFLNPGPYLFWGTVGGPLLCQGSAFDPKIFTLFTFTLYFALVGGKLLTAAVAFGGREWLSPRRLCLLHRVLGVVLVYFSVSYFFEAFKKLGGAA